MYQAVLDVGAIVEIQTKHCPCFHSAYYLAIGLLHISGAYICSVSAQLSASLKIQQPAKRMRVMQL